MNRSKRVSGTVILVCLAFASLGCAEFRAARLYAQGTAALNAGRAEAAIPVLDRAGRLAPDASEIQNHLGLAFSATGQQEKALSAFQRATDLDCSNSAAVQNLAAARALAAGGPAPDEAATGSSSELADLNRDPVSVQVP